MKGFFSGVFEGILFLIALTNTINDEIITTVAMI